MLELILSVTVLSATIYFLVMAKKDYDFYKNPGGRKCWYVTPGGLRIPAEVKSSGGHFVGIELACGTRLRVKKNQIEPRYGRLF